MHTPSMTNSPRPMSPTRRGALSIAMWVFGLSTTLLLVGLWGRAVAVDQVTVEQSAQAVVDAEVAQDRIYDWIESAIVESGDVGSAEVESLLSEWRERPEFNEAIDNVIGAFVAALFAPSGSTAVIDLREAIAPAVPVIVGDLQDQSLPIEEDALVEALDDASAIELDTGGAEAVSTIVGEARAILTRVVVLSFVAMIVAGAAALVLARDNYAMLRTLAIRVALSAVSFAILFRLGSWALDPDGGRSPIGAGGSIVLGSNGHVFFVIAGIAAAIGAFGAWVAWQRKRPTAVIDQPESVVDVSDVAEDDTRELASV